MEWLELAAKVYIGYMGCGVLLALGVIVIIIAYCAYKWRKPW